MLMQGMGMGIGGVMQVLVIIMQNGVPQRTGLATSDATSATVHLPTVLDREIPAEPLPIGHIG